jgi:hypothetical protein
MLEKGSEDIGKRAYGILKKAGDKFKGKKVYVAGDILTFAEMTKIRSEVTGKISLPGFPSADDMANAFHYLNANDKNF